MGLIFLPVLLWAGLLFLATAILSLVSVRLTLRYGCLPALLQLVIGSLLVWAAVRSTWYAEYGGGHLFAHLPAFIANLFLCGMSPVLLFLTGWVVRVICRALGVPARQA